MQYFLMCTLSNKSICSVYLGENSMEPQIADKRIRRSIKLIKDSFFSLSKEMPPEAISVTDICNHADINRGTFYAHFENMDALLKDMETELSILFLQAFSLYGDDMNSEAAVDALFDCIRNNPELVAFSCQIGRLVKGNKTLEKAIRKYTLSEWFGKGQISSEQALLLEAFITSGGTQIIEMWVESDFTLDEDMVKDVFINAIKYGVSHYVNLDII